MIAIFIVSAPPRGVPRRGLLAQERCLVKLAPVAIPAGRNKSVCFPLLAGLADAHQTHRRTNGFRRRAPYRDVERLFPAHGQPLLPVGRQEAVGWRPLSVMSGSSSHSGGRIYRGGVSLAHAWRALVRGFGIPVPQVAVPGLSGEDRPASACSDWMEPSHWKEHAPDQKLEHGLVAKVVPLSRIML